RTALGSAEVDTRADGAIQVVGEPSDTAPDGTIEIHLVHPIERCVRNMSKVPPQESSAEKAVGAECAVGSVVGQRHEAPHVAEMEFGLFCLRYPTRLRERKTACCRATWAVVGRDLPSTPAKLEQSPRANTLSSSLLCNVGRTTICPRWLTSRPSSFETTSGALTPAAQTTSAAWIR